MNSALSAVLLGLASAACWGAGDFSGGLATRRSSVYTVVAISQLVGVTLLLALTILLGEPLPPSTDLLFGALAGLSGAIALLALYSSLAGGRMGAVAPVTAMTTAAVPVLFGLLIEGLPAVRQLFGFAVALVAVWLITRAGDGDAMRLRELGLPLLAGLASGVFLILIAQAGRSSVLWPIAAARAASIILLFVMALSLSRSTFPERRYLPIIALAGTLDVGGNALFALAARTGRLDIAAILSSLYPAVTVLLAWIILKEHLSWHQWLGVYVALVVVILIAG